MTELDWAAGSGGSVPDGAYETEGQYIGRAHHDQAVVIGPICAGASCCTIAYCGEAFNKDEYEVLLTPVDGRRLRWEPFSGEPPEGAVKGGYHRSGHPLYVARAERDGKLVVGHVNAVDKVCCIPSSGECFDCDQFHILVVYEV